MTPQSECLRLVSASNVSLFEVLLHVNKAELCILKPFDLSGGVCIKNEWQGTQLWKVIQISLPAHHEISANEIAVFGITSQRNFQDR